MPPPRSLALALLLALAACAPPAPVVPSPIAAAPTLRFAPPTPTPGLPAQTIGADTLAALRPLRAVGVGRAVQAAIARDGSFLAVATTTGVALVELPSARLAQFFELPGGAERVLLSPDGERIAVLRVNPEVVELRKVADGAVLGSAHGRSLAFSPDGALFAGGGDERTTPPNYTTLWRSADGQKIAELPGDDPAFAPDGKTIATRVVGDGNVGTWLRRADGSEIGFVNGADARFSPDSGLVAVTVFPLDSSAPQTGVYRTADAEPIWSVDGSLPTFSADGILAVANGRAIKVYHAGDGSPLATLTPGPADPEAYGKTDVIAMAFTGNSDALYAAVGGDLYGWVKWEGKPLSDTPLRGLVLRGGQPDATFSPSVTALISRNVVGDADCGLYTGLRVHSLDGREIASDPQGVAAEFSDDGTRAVIVSSLGTVRVVALGAAKGEIVAKLPGYGAIAFSGEGATLAASQARSGLNPFGPSAVELHDVAGGALMGSLEVDSYLGEPISLRFGDANALYAEEESACDFVYTVTEKAWDLRAGGKGKTLWEAPVVADEPQPQAASIRAFSPRTGIGAWATSEGVASVVQGGVTTTLTLPAPVTALAYAPDGAALAVGDAAGTVQLLDARSNAPAQPRSTPSNPANLAVTRITFSPDGAFTAARLSDGQVRVWRDVGKAPIATLATDPDDTLLVFSPDNTLLISAGPKGVSFYSLADGRKLRTLNVVASGVAMGPGRRLLAILSDERVTLWGIP